MVSIEDVKEKFNKSLQANEPKEDPKSIKKYFWIGFFAVISGIILNYYFNNNNSKINYAPPDVDNIVKNQEGEDQDPLFQKF